MWTCRIAVKAGMEWSLAEAAITVASESVITKQAIMKKLKEGCFTNSAYLERPKAGQGSQAFAWNGKTISFLVKIATPICICSNSSPTTDIDKFRQNCGLPIALDDGTDDGECVCLCGCAHVCACVQ